MSSTKQRNDNGSGSIYFHEASGRWKAEISWTDYSGKTNRKSFSSKKKTDVRKKLEEFKKQLLLNNGIMSGGDVLFEDFAKNWMQTKQKLKLKPTSFLRKEVTLNNQVFSCWCFIIAARRSRREMSVEVQVGKTPTYPDPKGQGHYGPLDAPGSTGCFPQGKCLLLRLS